MGNFRSLAAAATLAATLSTHELTAQTRIQGFFQWEPYAVGSDQAPSGKREYGHSQAGGFRLYQPIAHNVLGVHELDVSAQLGSFVRIVNGSFPSMKINPPEPVDFTVHNALALDVATPVHVPLCGRLGVSGIFFRFDHRPSDENAPPEGRVLAQPGYYSAFAAGVSCHSAHGGASFERRVATPRQFGSALNTIRSQLTYRPQFAPVSATLSWRQMQNSEDQRPYTKNGLSLRLQTEFKNINVACDIGQEFYAEPYPVDRHGGLKEFNRVSASILLGSPK